MTPAAQALVDSWSVPLWITVSLCLAALVYLRGWFRLHTAFPGLISASRLVAFLAGIASVWIAAASPLNVLDDISLSVHMIQHLLLMTIAPLLILVGAPALPLLHGLPQAVARTVVSPVLRLRLVKSLGHFLTHPAVCWLAATMALLAWHVPAVFELALKSDWIHKLEHACFFGTGLLFWWPVIQPWPSTARWPDWSVPLYLFCGTFPCDLLSGLLVFGDRLVYKSYLSAPRLFNISPLEDQQLAAALMWVSVTVIFLIPAVLVSLRVLSPRTAPSLEDRWAGIDKTLRQPFDSTNMGAI
jgi:putative membrane protein